MKNGITSNVGVVHYINHACMVFIPALWCCKLLKLNRLIIIHSAVCSYCSYPLFTQLRLQQLLQLLVTAFSLCCKSVLRKLESTIKYTFEVPFLRHFMLSCLFQNGKYLIPQRFILYALCLSWLEIMP